MSNILVPASSAVPIGSLRRLTRTLHDSISRVATGLRVLGGNDAASQSLANTLNARAEKGELSSNFISISSSDPGTVPFIDPISIGLGK